mgnify:CR=1 FL=1
MKILPPIVGVFISLVLWANPAESQPNERLIPYWHWIQSNLIAQERILQIGSGNDEDSQYITNVNIVKLPEGEVRANSAVLIEDGKIAWIGTDLEIPAGMQTNRIDGRGRYLSPGLFDMHVHTQNDFGYLLQLSMGVTSIREMNGDLRLLARQQAVNDGELFIPNMFVVGPILNSNDLNGFAIAVNTLEEAKAEVRRAAENGYQAIKVHNGLANDVFHAIALESKRVGLPLVGHIPVSVTVAEAIESGMSTAEHFKGYLIDNTLQVSTEDWVSASVGMQMFLTPTFSTYREKLRGEDALDLLAREGHLVPPFRRVRWLDIAGQEITDKTRLRQAAFSKQEAIFKELISLDLNWLAGTDAGSYDTLVPGFALLEELEIMEDFGLPTLEVLKAATTSAANALGWQDHVGRVEIGMQADLLLLDENPLETVSNLRSVSGVMLRGRWIDEPILLRLTDKDYSNVSDDVTHDALENAIDTMISIQERGFPVLENDLRIMGFLSRSSGFEDLLQKVNDFETPQ